MQKNKQNKTSHYQNRTVMRITTVNNWDVYYCGNEFKCEMCLVTMKSNILIFNILILLSMVIGVGSCVFFVFFTCNL